MPIETGRTTIRQLRATSTDRDPFAYQLRLGSMLSSADLHPPGVSASAIICIRTLHAPPLPTQALRYGGGCPPLWWAERVRALIKHALQQASHPLHDTVPTNCEAIIFADRAELLACLASDWCAGDSSDHWWWQSLFCAGAIELFLVPAWHETPEYIPSALLHLASQRKATAFVRRLPTNDVRSLLHSIIRTFALHELQSVLATAISSQPFSAAALLKEHEHVSAPSETSKTSATTDTTAIIDTLEIPEKSEATNTFATTATTDTTDTTDTIATSVTTNTSDLSGTAGTTHPFATTTTTDTSTPTGLPDEYSQAPVGADLSRPSPHPACTLSGGQVITGNNRPFPLANTSAPTMDEQTPRATSLSQAPWLPWVPESTEHGLSPEQQALLGVGLMLLRAPAIVRTPSFAQSVYHWYSTDQHIAPLYPTPTNTPGAISIPQPSPPKENASQTKLTNKDLSHIPHPRVPASGYLSPRQGTPTMASHPGEAASSMVGEPHPGDDEGPLAGTLRAEQKQEHKDLQTLLEPVSASLETQIETAYGGIFYLINLALFLNLYGDFTTPLQPGIALPIWDFVALLGQQMLGEHIVADPVWPLLAQLTGRHVEEAPGCYFEPPEHWRIPPAWLSAFPEEAAWRWSVENRRLRVLHPAQFLLLDVPLDTNNPTAQLRHELNSYANVYSQGMPQLQYTSIPLWPGATLLPCGRSAISNLDSTLPLSLSLQRWLHWLMPYVYARLQRALGLAATEDLSRKLCRHDASIALTATQMHITFALSELPIEIRIAGLDRDPGWVPAAGRFIAFHFQ